MKRLVRMILTITLLITNLLVMPPIVHASNDNNSSKAIAIVFDNSGSMYDLGDQAWCRATYAMEVFASMLNEGDILQIYPMHPIIIDDKEYTMEAPFQITSASQAQSIRNIFTSNAGGTPIESIDNAISGLQLIHADDKYMVVLTDGGTFSKNGYGLSKERTKVELDKRITENAGEEMKIMYLGIGSEACVPDTAQSEYFVKKQAVNTEDVLSTLTVMCNLIFGRDLLPRENVTGNTIDFDISMNKLIVFVQGDNISDLKIKAEDENANIKLLSARQTKYSTNGAGDYKSVPDTSLQGMIVTYEDLSAGRYLVEYSGTASNAEIYYEPDADLEFIFTDSKGNNVDLNSLYEGEYKVSFGMKDAKTGNLISSNLLGNPHYEGSYSINGEKVNFTHDGYSGEVPIDLKMNDLFEANLTVTYLSGYTITKNSTDFGWPKGGVKVLVPPLGEFKTELIIPQDYILIKDLEKSEAIIADLTIDGEKLSKEEFNAVTLAVDFDGLNYKVIPKEEDSQYLIKLDSMEEVDEGDYSITIDAQYLDEADRQAQSTDSSIITLSNIPLWLKWAIGISLFLILAILLWIILHIRVLPKHVHTSKNLSSMNYDGDDVGKSANFLAEVKKKNAKIQAQFGGKKFGISMDVSPGKESYLYKPQKQRNAEVKVASVRKFGPAKIQEALIGSTKYVADETTGKLVPALPNQKPFMLTNGMTVRYSGTIQDAGIDKDFEVTSKLNFKKKK